jgi:hypothetical protein
VCPLPSPQFLNGDHRFSLDTILELGALLLQAYRGDHSRERDSAESVQSIISQLCPAYALTRSATSVTVDQTTKIDPLAPMADALNTYKMADRITRAHQGVRAAVWQQLPLHELHECVVRRDASLLCGVHRGVQT